MDIAVVPDLEQLALDLGKEVRLEIIGGVPVWRPMPGYGHQRRVDRIRQSIAPAPGTNGGASCACFHIPDTLIRFGPALLRRPDIAIFCAEPADTDQALTVIPDAVVEIISPGTADKDFSNPPLYLAAGVRDVLVVDRRAGIVTHYDAAGNKQRATAYRARLHCGCELTL